VIYNFNIGIGWASSGVEYAQAYRANIFRRLGLKAKFVFTDMFSTENIEHMTKAIGFEDDEIIWLYTWFTDTGISPVTFTMDDLMKTVTRRATNIVKDQKKIRIDFGDGDFYTAYLTDENSDRVHRVEIVSDNKLIRKDYYTHCRIYSEYYAPLDKRAHLYQRRFFNKDGSVAYEELNDDENVMYKFPDKVLYSKEELIGYMVKGLNLKSDDLVIIDRSTGVGQAVLRNHGDSKIGVVIHADHFSESATDDTYIRWNNYYEYEFSQIRHIDFYVAATEVQKNLLAEQFKKYKNVSPRIETIPVGSVDELKYPKKDRIKHSIITASRLANEKHVDWVVQAVIKAREVVPDITLDIYGKGKEEERLTKIISEHNAQDYIRLKGHCDLKEVYQEYEAYISGSTSEGFGLSVLEAIAAGLPVVGFDVRYGNQTFIADGRNGYLIPWKESIESGEAVDGLKDRLIRLFSEADMDAFHEMSYEIAEKYLTTEVEKRWKEVIEQTI